MTGHSSSRLLRRAEACAYLRAEYNIVRTVGTLAKYACCSSVGPRFVTVGRFPMYPVEELDRWATSLMGPLRSSTSDTGAASSDQTNGRAQ